jgi:cytochrome c biogenesis protein CcmG/thiol:disulfide interchange protein DsbE
MRRLLFALPLLAFAAIAAWFAAGLARDPNVLPSALLDREMPGFALPALAGTDAPALSDQAIRGRVALVNVFASWCIPCRAEHPALLRLAKEGVAVWGISYKDKPEDARRFLADLGMPYQRLGVDAEGRTFIDFGAYGVPETFIVDAEGRIRFRMPGPITPASEEEKFRAALKQVMK